MVWSVFCLSLLFINLIKFYQTDKTIQMLFIGSNPDICDLFREIKDLCF